MPNFEHGMEDPNSKEQEEQEPSPEQDTISQVDMMRFLGLQFIRKDTEPLMNPETGQKSPLIEDLDNQHSCETIKFQVPDPPSLHPPKTHLEVEPLSEPDNSLPARCDNSTFI